MCLVDVIEHPLQLLGLPLELPNLVTSSLNVLVVLHLLPEESILLLHFSESPIQCLLGGKCGPSLPLHLLLDPVDLLCREIRLALHISVIALVLLPILRLLPQIVLQSAYLVNICHALPAFLLQRLLKSMQLFLVPQCFLQFPQLFFLLLQHRLTLGKLLYVSSRLPPLVVQLASEEVYLVLSQLHFFR